MGTIVRYAVQGGVQRLLGSSFPYGTLAVNVTGSFAVGFLATVFLERAAVSPLWRSAVLIGFCGGFTTFSALTYETFELARTGDPVRGVLNLAAHAVTAKILRLSEDLPIVIELVDTAEKIQPILPILDEMVADGMVTLEKVQVIAYRASPRPKPL